VPRAAAAATTTRTTPARARAGGAATRERAEAEPGRPDRRRPARRRRGRGRGLVLPRPGRRDRDGGTAGLQAAGSTEGAPNVGANADGGAQTAGTPPADAAAPGNGAATPPPADGAAEGALAAAPGEGAPAEAENPKPAKQPVERDPASVDLNALEDLGPTPGVSAEEWQRIRDLVATALDPESGVAGNRARRELEELGKPAFPAIINKMRTIDYSTVQGYRNGDIAQQMLEKIANGKNFGWHYTPEPNDEYFNKRVVQSWHGQWLKVKDDDAAWRKFTGLAEEVGGGEEPRAADSTTTTSTRSTTSDRSDLPRSERWRGIFEDAAPLAFQICLPCAGSRAPTAGDPRVAPTAAMRASRRLRRRCRPRRRGAGR
jgi:hypothetical protein